MEEANFKAEALTTRFQKYLIQEGLTVRDAGMFEWFEGEALINGDPCFGRASVWAKEGMPDVLNAINKMNMNDQVRKS